MDIVITLINLIVFPGFIFLSAYSLICEYFDRKIYAKLQNRVGPPFFQPFADFWKLLAKEEVVPRRADRKMFIGLPIFGTAAVITAFIYIPIYSAKSVFPFTGDIIVVTYLLTLPALVFFLAGWHSSNFFGIIGSMRLLTQLFGYEVPFFLAILSPVLITGEWTLSSTVAYQLKHVWLIFWLPLSFIVAIVALVGKLERVPFDIPTAEQEIVAGPFTEYSGTGLALMRLMIDMEMVAGAGLIAVLFMGGFHMPGVHLPGIAGIIMGLIAFIIKTLIVVFILATIRALFARLRIEQMVNVCIKWLVPLAIIQLIIIVWIKYRGAI